MSGTETVCPVCTAAQPDGLLCHADTLRLEQALGDVRSLVADLDVTLSRQARIGTPGKGGLAREKNPIHYGALEAADNLSNVLTTWARDVDTLDTVWGYAPGKPAVSASGVLLHRIDAIRRHPAVAELVDEITDAVEQARRVIDRPIDRAYLGQCWVEHPVEGGEMVTCYEEIWGRPDAREVACRTCLHVHDVAERRSTLLDRAGHLIVTVKQAAEYMGEVGGVTVNQKTIRTWIDREQLPTHVGATPERHIRLGDLFELLAQKRMRTTVSVA